MPVLTVLLVVVALLIGGQALFLEALRLGLLAAVVLSVVTLTSRSGELGHRRRIGA